MAEKGFGVKEINLIGASGTPTIESPNNLNLNAVNVAISTNATIGGNLTVTGTVGIAGTLTYEDVTNVDAVGIITARDGIFIPDNKKIHLGDTSGSGDLQIYHDSSNSYIKDQGTGQLVIDGNAVILQYSASTKLTTTNTGVTVNGTLAATAVTGDGSGLTGIAVTEAPVTDYTITGSNPNYYFHGGGVDETAGNPDLYLIRGQKYRFNNTTGSGHPFKIRVSNGGSNYTDGLTGDDEGVQFFTVPYAAPATLVYQCEIHGGMVGNIYIRGGSSTVTVSSNADNRVITGGSGGNLNGESALTFNGSRLTLDGDLIVEGQSNTSGAIRLVHDQGLQNHDYWMLESNKDTHAFNIKSYGTGSYVDAITVSQNTRSVGILTSNIDAANLSNPVGAGHSLVGLYIGDGSLLFSDQLARSGGYYITTGVNALNAGPVTLNSEMKLDGTWTLV